VILYNTSMGVVAGLALILVSLLLRRAAAAALPAFDNAEPDPAQDRPVAVAPAGGTFDPRLWAVVFGALGLVLAPLGALMATTWPLTVNPPLNFIFGEPCLILGVLLLAAAVYLWHLRGDLAGLQQVDLTPVAVVVIGLGGVLIACAAAIARFEIVGGAPAAEPITGLLNGYPLVENTFFVLLYLAAGLGAILAPLSRLRPGWLLTAARWLWFGSGLVFALFSILNYYTHAGLDINLRLGTEYRI